MWIVAKTRPQRISLSLPPLLSLSLPLALSLSLYLQLRELRLEVDELHISRVQEDVISRAETRVKELENTLRLEERSVTQFWMLNKNMSSV